MSVKYVKIDCSEGGIMVLRMAGWLSLISGLFVAVFLVLNEPSPEIIGLSVLGVVGGVFILGLSLTLATIAESALYLKEYIKNSDENVIYQEKEE